MPDRLREAQPTFAATGGLHATGLFDAQGALLCVREDVGRHNAMDKVVGWAFQAGRLPLAAVAPDRNVKGALQGDLLKSVEQASGSLRFGNIIELNGELAANTAQDASSIADVLKFLLSLAQSSASGQAAQFATLLKNLSVSAQASAVKLSGSIPFRPPSARRGSN